jgi:DNA-binding SARP family transcriptional activator
MGERDAAAAISTLERWTSLNPDEESAWRRLIDAHLRTEDLAGARRVWSAYRHALAALDAEPSDQMADLHNQILGLRGAELERWLNAAKRDPATVRLELSSRTA